MSLNAYYSSDIDCFLKEKEDEIYRIILENNKFSNLTDQQKFAWKEEIKVMKKVLLGIKGRVLFEYVIPRMGRRVDVVVLSNNIIFLLEFKCGSDNFESSHYDQTYGYALDLRSFHKESNGKLIATLLISTGKKAPEIKLEINEEDRIISPIKCNCSNIRRTIDAIIATYNEDEFDYEKWENSDYYPTPTIIEFARSIYSGHKVTEITRHASGENIILTKNEIDNIVDYSKKNHKKSICFITGVPGAGKTLVGLNISHEYSTAGNAVFLSGNDPLVRVLQKALTRDKIEQLRHCGIKEKKENVLRGVISFIQIIHNYRDCYVNNTKVPPEHIAIFDESQRAWTKNKISIFMMRKKGIADFSMSEPEFLISTMDRHKDWAMVVCLVGGGQEIADGEAGLPEWFESIKRSFREWDVYIAPQLNNDEYLMGNDWNEMISGLNVKERPNLHLPVSIRSYNAPSLANFVSSLLKIDKNSSRKHYLELKKSYPLKITRDLIQAKKWTMKNAKGNRRYGIVAESNSLRLKAEGIFVNSKINVEKWFLNGKDDVLSSYQMEDVATEFDIQGLELDYIIFAWDANLRFVNDKWEYYCFSGSKWNVIRNENKKRYLINSYCVLLTRAREGMIIYVPRGDNSDGTRLEEFYDGVFNYFKEIGIEEL